jgi:hypothetical protein
MEIFMDDVQNRAIGLGLVFVVVVGIVLGPMIFDDLTKGIGVGISRMHKEVSENESVREKRGHLRVQGSGSGGALMATVVYLAVLRAGAC